MHQIVGYFIYEYLTNLSKLQSKNESGGKMNDKWADLDDIKVINEVPTKIQQHLGDLVWTSWKIVIFVRIITVHTNRNSNRSFKPVNLINNQTKQYPPLSKVEVLFRRRFDVTYSWNELVRVKKFDGVIKYL